MGSIFRAIGSCVISIVIISIPILTGISFCLNWGATIKYILILGLITIFLILWLFLYEITE